MTTMVARFCGGLCVKGCSVSFYDCIASTWTLIAGEFLYFASFIDFKSIAFTRLETWAKESHKLARVMVKRNRLDP